MDKVMDPSHTGAEICFDPRRVTMTRRGRTRFLWERVWWNYTDGLDMGYEKWSLLGTAKTDKGIRELMMEEL